MSKTILIPTDFSVKSLNLAKTALQKDKGKLDIILIHGLLLSDSITELLFYSKKKLLAKLETPEFQDSCQLLLSKYEEKINSLTIDVFSWKSQSAFDNYLDANEVKDAYIPVNYEFEFKNPSSFDLIPFFRKANLQLHEVDWHPVEPKIAEKHSNQLAEIFFTHGKIAH